MRVENPLYQQSGFPVFQNRTYESTELARQCPKGDIYLVQNGRSGLIYNASFRSDWMEYDASYQNEQAHSPSFVKHLEQVAAIVETTLGTRDLVEVGCGKAFFLEFLQSRGCSITGFDPTYDGNNPVVQRRYFTKGVNFSAQGIVLRHVLEHIQDPFTFLQSLLHANNGKGLIYIEVPCFEWILHQRTWFDIFYEHVNYFRMSDLSRMFTRVIDSGHLFGGQYLYLVADLSSLREPAGYNETLVEIPKDFLPAVLSPLDDTPRGPTVVWGAASKGVIYALLRERSGDPVTTIVDLNPAKWGRFVPATGLRVISPKEAIDSLKFGTEICVMNSNYTDEIREMTGNRFKLTGVENE